MNVMVFFSQPAYWAETQPETLFHPSERMEIDQTLLGAEQAFIAENVPAAPPTYGTFQTPHLSLSQWRIGEMATNGDPL
jgi:hypothetical protein